MNAPGFPKIPPQPVAICAHCKHPLPPDAMSTDLRGATIQCALCPEQAHFIIRGSARCFEHRHVDSGWREK